MIPAEVDDEGRAIARSAFAGLLWNKQLYRYSVEHWLDGDPGVPAAAANRARPAARATSAGRTSRWPT